MFESANSLKFMKWDNAKVAVRKINKNKPKLQVGFFFLIFRKLTALPWPSLCLFPQQPDVTLGSNIANEYISQKNGFAEWITPNIFAKCVTEDCQEILFKKVFLVQTNILVWIHL